MGYGPASARPGVSRRVTPLLAPALLAIVLLWAPGSTASAHAQQADTGDTAVVLAADADGRTAEERFAAALLASHLDAARRANGVDPRTVELLRDDELGALARSSSDRMARLGRMEHDTRIRDALCCGSRFADNIGYWSLPHLSGADRLRGETAALVAAWLDSPGHRSNLLDDRYTHVGVGVTRDDHDVLWATVVYQARGSVGTDIHAAADDRPATLVRPVEQLTAACPGGTDGGTDTDPDGDHGAVDTTVSSRFVDVQGRHGAAIDCLAHRGVIRGVSADRYAPTTTLTRSQLALLVHRALEEAGVQLPAALRNAFNDVAPGSTAGPAIERLAAAGIVTGRSDGDFRPHEPITRAQLAAVVDASLRWLGEADTAHARGSFRDVPVDRRAARAIDHVAARGLMVGDEQGRFRPDAPLRRDHAAAVLARTLDELLR